MKKIIFALPLFFFLTQLSAQDNPWNFNPTIKVKGLVHSRFESSLTDSIDVQGKFNADPVQYNFRMRRIELRLDITLNDHWSGVIRAQLPELKTTSPTTGRVIELAYFQWKANDMFLVRGGQMKAPFELDELTSHEDLRMIDRGPTSRLFTNNSYSSYQPGLMVQGTFAKDKMPFSYYAGVFNGSDRSVNYDVNSNKNVVGRLEFTPIKGIRLGGNAEFGSIDDDNNASAFGGDLSIQRELSDKLFLIVEGEYITGTNSTSFIASTDSLKDVDDFEMSGYFGQALLRIHLNQKWCKTFEVGGKYEFTDPTSATQVADGFKTYTGGVGFIFLPDNTARLQLNVVNTDYDLQIAGAQKNNLMFIAQLQLKI